MHISSAFRVLGVVAVLATGGLSAGSALAEEASPELDKLRAAVAKYKDPVVAVRDGYFSTLGCVTFEAGTMGVHFLNPALLGPEPDPLKPTLLVYEPVGEKLELVGVEWLIPLATGVKKRPALFGQTFDGPMEGHEPLLPAALHHYDLHAWIFKDNPLGMFSPVNPDVKCPPGPYTLLEEAPKMVPHPGMEE